MLVIRHSYRDKNEDTCLWPVLCTILKMQATILSPRAEIRIASIFFVFCTFVFFFFFNLFFLLLYLFVCFYSLFTQGIYRIECYTLLKHYNKLCCSFFKRLYKNCAVIFIIRTNFHLTFYMCKHYLSRRKIVHVVVCTSF